MTVDKTPEFAFDRKERFFDGSTLTYKIFADVPEEHRVTEKTKQGTRLMVAHFPDTSKLYLRKYIPVGTQNYPKGAVKVWNKEDEQMQYYYIESVAVHPKGGIHNFE